MTDYAITPGRAEAAGRVMSTDLLREAAALMRQRVRATDPAPWHLRDADEVEDNHGRSIVETYGAAMPNAEHIASWHPAVALAVADLLQHEADVEEQYGAEGSPLAVAVARAYLGRPS